MRILLLQNVGSRYGVLEAMTNDLGKAFARQGVETKVFDRWEEGPSSLLKTIQEFRPHSTFGINLFAHKELPFDLYGVNHICLCVDALSHNTVLTEEKIDPKHTAILFTDAWSSDLSETLGMRSFWFPHAIAKEFLDEVSTKKLLPLSKRPYDIVLLGSYLDYEQEMVLWKQLFSPKEINLLLDIIEELLENAESSIQHTLLAFVQKNPAINDALQKNSLSVWKFIASVELYMRGLDRKRLIQAFRGASIHIFGNGWTSSPNCTVHPPISFSSVFDVCAQAKVVLNSTPMIRRGYHERLFLGLAAGACVVTSKLNVPKLEDIPSLIQYTTSSLSHLSADIPTQEYFPPLAWLGKNHTWDVRIENFLPWFEKNYTI